MVVERTSLATPNLPLTNAVLIFIRYSYMSVVVFICFNISAFSLV